MKSLRIVLIVAAVLGVTCGAGFAQKDDIKQQLPTKWSQWVDIETGYDIFSFWHDDNPEPTTVIADDWRCPDGRPVTDVHWWGSYLDGGPTGLVGFKITIFADIPPDGVHPSHPGTVLWDSYYTRLGFEEQVYAANGETVYQYNADLTLPFEQDQGAIYWLAITALVDNDATWGWHTAVRPQPDNTLDDAVMMFNYDPETGSYLTYSELFDAQGSVAMAFELTTVPEPGTFVLVGMTCAAVLALRRRRARRTMLLLLAVAAAVSLGGTLYAPPFTIDGELPNGPPPVLKWIQLPDLLTGRDIYSFWSPGDDFPTVVVADDWRCLDGLPITDIHWWGSYPDGKPVGAPGVLSFEVSIHSDIPAVGSVPSHPGTLLWSDEYLVGTQVVETFFAADNNDEDVYRYDLLLSEADWFYQEQNDIYWLDIIARTSVNDVTWGWHTAMRPGPDNGLDAAVMLYDYDPSTGDYSQWGALYDFCHVQMAFAVTTVPEPASIALVGTAALVALGLVRRRKLN